MIFFSQLQIGRDRKVFCGFTPIQGLKPCQREIDVLDTKIDMSEPTNHHYVSQVHLKNFFNIEEGKIFVYDKKKNNFYYKTTTKTLFSEEFSNTRYIQGELDHSTLENDLNKFFEKDFKHHYKIVLKFIEDKILNKTIRNSLSYFAKYGIIADFRTPRYKQNFEDTILNSINSFFSNCTPELKAQIEEMFEYREKVKYGNSLSYSETADQVIKSMGNLIFNIQIPINKDDYFVIPDVAAATVRAKINSYFNSELEEIAYIGLPLSSKLYLHLSSEKLYKNQIPDSIITLCESSTVESLNKANLDYSQSTIACENREYLEIFVKKNL